MTAGPSGGRDPLGDRASRATDRLIVTGGRPSGARLFVCLIVSAGVVTVAYTVAFSIATAHEMRSPLGVIGVGMLMLVFWTPATLWSSAYLSVPIVVMLAAVAALLTHRYRLLALSSAWHRASRVSLTLLVACGAWSVLLGLVFGLAAVKG